MGSGGCSREQGRYAFCADRPLLIDWRINRYLVYAFSIDTEAERILPAPLQIIERLPGLAVMSVGVLRYEPGQFGPASPMFHELVGAIHVAPDLSVDMPLPNMTFSSFQVLSDSEDFVEQEGYTALSPLPARGAGGGPHRGRAGGERVGPGQTHHVDAELPPRARLDPSGDVGAALHGHEGAQHGIWEWDGHLLEHQRPLKGW